MRWKDQRTAWADPTHSKLNSRRRLARRSLQGKRSIERSRAGILHARHLQGEAIYIPPARENSGAFVIEAVGEFEFQNVRPIDRAFAAAIRSRAGTVGVPRGKGNIIRFLDGVTLSEKNWPLAASVLS